MQQFLYNFFENKKIIGMYFRRKGKNDLNIVVPGGMNKQLFELEEYSPIFRNKLQKTKSEYESQYDRWEKMRNKIKMKVIGESFGEGRRQNSLHLIKKQVGKQSEIIGKLQRSQKMYRSRPQTSRHIASFTSQIQISSKSKIHPASYRQKQKSKHKLFRASLSDMQKIQRHQLVNGQTENPSRKILFRKSLIYDSIMHAIEVSVLHKGVVFTCETMGEVFGRSKLAIGPQEVAEFNYAFDTLSYYDLALRLFDYMVVENLQIKLDKQRIIKETKSKYLVKRHGQKNEKNIRKKQKNVWKIENETKIKQVVNEKVEKQIDESIKMAQSKIHSQIQSQIQKSNVISEQISMRNSKLVKIEEMSLVQSRKEEISEAKNIQEAAELPNESNNINNQHIQGQDASKQAQLEVKNEQNEQKEQNIN